MVAKYCMLVVLVTCTAITSGEPKSEMVGNSDQKGEVTVVTGVNVSSVVQAVLAGRGTIRVTYVNQRGVMHEVKIEDKLSGSLQIGVFERSSEAQAAGQAFLQSFSMPAPMVPIPDLGDMAVLYGNTNIVFTRDNVLVVLGISEGSLPDSGRESLAAKIDGLLREGTNGVVRGSSVLLPKIVKVTPTDSVKANGVIDLTVTIGVPVECLGNAGLAAWNGGPEGTSSQKEDAYKEVEYTWKLRFTAEERKHRRWICFATEDCRTVSKEIELGSGSSTTASSSGDLLLKPTSQPGAAGVGVPATQPSE